jgi:hypothetical protein
MLTRSTEDRSRCARFSAPGHLRRLIDTGAPRPSIRWEADGSIGRLAVAEAPRERAFRQARSGPACEGIFQMAGMRATHSFYREISGFRIVVEPTFATCRPHRLLGYGQVIGEVVGHEKSKKKSALTDDHPASQSR